MQPNNRWERPEEVATQSNPKRQRGTSPLPHCSVVTNAPSLSGDRYASDYSQLCSGKREVAPDELGASFGAKDGSCFSSDPCACSTTKNQY
jgi:hypothetical protein